MKLLDMRTRTIHIVEEWYEREPGDNELISYRMFMRQAKAIEYGKWLREHNKKMDTKYRVRLIMSEPTC